MEGAVPCHSLDEMSSVGTKSSMGFLSPCKALGLAALGRWLLELSLGADIVP